MNGTAIDLAPRPGGGEVRLSPGPADQFWFLGVLRCLLILFPALSLRGSLLGGRPGGLLMGVLERQCLSQPVKILRGKGLPGSFLHRQNRLGLRCLTRFNLPGAVAQSGLLRPSAQRVKCPGLCFTHGCQQHPISQADSLPAQQFSPVKIPAQGNLLQVLFQSLGGIGHDQPVLGPGHSHIQHPHFLGYAFRCHFHGDGPFCKGRVAHPVFLVHRGQSQAQGFVAENLAAQALLVKLPGEVAQKHHRELQSFGFVDAHNGNAAGRHRALRRQAPAFQGLKVVQELGQIPEATLLVAHRQFIEQPQIGPFGLAAGHGCVNAVHPGQGKAAFQQSGQRLLPGFPAKLSQDFQKILGFGAWIGTQGIVHCAGFPGSPEGCQIICSKIEQGTCQCGDQRNVLPGILDNLQKRPEGTNFRRLHQVGAAAGGAADSPGFQRPLENGPGASWGAEQDHDILRLHRTQLSILAHRGALPEHGLNPVRHKIRFFLVGVFPNRDGVQFRSRGSQRNVRDSLLQHFRTGIVKSSHFRAHTGSEHIVYRSNHLAAGPEIPAEQHLSALPGGSLVRRDIIPVFFQENPRIRQTKLIDGLLHVPHQKAVLPLFRQRHENSVLDAVGVLILVHQDLPEPSGDFRCRSGWAAPVFSQQQIQRPVFQVAEVQHPAAALRRRIGPVKISYQRNQSTDSRR